MRFGAELPVNEVLKEIKLKQFDEKLAALQKDHGLFMPPKPDIGRKGEWLDNHKTLRFYDLQNDDVLEYKKKHRNLTVRLADGTSKRMVIDDSQTVGGISAAIGQKLGVKSSFFEFSLRKVSNKIRWLDDHKTLHEQDIGPEEELEYGKKYFFTDDLVDKDDPHTLNLLYWEANRAILESRYPTTRTDAKDFAALQMQVVFGDHKPQHKERSYLNPTTFLPLAYQKDKKIIDDIVRDHKKLCGMNELSAKFRYMQLVRSLKFYGTTYFHCIERKKDSKKSAPVIFGISKSKLTKLEPNFTLIKEWTFAMLRRWLALKDLLTVDFGDGEGDYLEFVTEDADAISQLIAGYIELILKTRSDQSRAVADSSEEEAQIEFQDVDVGTGNIGIAAMYLPNYGQYAGIGASYGGDEKLNPQQSLVSQPFTKTNRLDVVDLATAARASIMLSAELGESTFVKPPVKLPEEAWQHQFTNHKNNIQKGVGELVDHFKGKETLTKAQLDAKAKEIYIDLKGMAAAARNLVSMNPANTSYIITSKAVAEAVGNLFKLIGSADLIDVPSMATSLEEAKKSIENGFLLLENANLNCQVDQGSHLLLLNVVSAVNTKFENLLAVAEKTSAFASADMNKWLKEVHAMKDVQLTNLTHLTPYVLNSTVLDRIHNSESILLAAGKQVLARAIKGGVTEEVQTLLGNLNEELSQELTRLNDALKVVEPLIYTPEGNVHSPVIQILENLATLRSDIDNPKVVLDVLTTISDVPRQLSYAINHMYAPPDASGNWNSDRLVKAASLVTDTLRDLLGLGRDYKPHNLAMKEKILMDATELETQAYLILSDIGSQTALSALHYSSKVSAAALLRLQTTIAECIPHIVDGTIKRELHKSMEEVSVIFPKILEALEISVKADAKELKPHYNLRDLVQYELPIVIKLIESAKGALSELEAVPEKKERLDKSVSEASKEISDLVKSLQDYSELGYENEMLDVFPQFEIARAELETAEFLAESGQLRNIMGQEKERAQKLLTKTIEKLRIASAELANAAKTGAPLGTNIKQMASLITSLTENARTVAASYTSRPAQKKILGRAKELVSNSIDMISQSRTLSIDPKSRPKKKALEKSNQVLTQNLGDLLNSYQGVDITDINKAIGNIKSTAKTLQPLVGEENFEELSPQIVSAVKALDTAINQMQLDARIHPERVNYQANVTSKTATTLMELLSYAGGAAEELSDDLLALAKELADRLANLLASTGKTAQSHSDANVDDLLKNTEAVNETLNEIAAVFGSSIAADTASDHLLDLVIKVDTNSIELVSGTREDILGEFLACAREFARSQNKLVDAARASDVGVGVYAKETALLAEKMLTAAKAANVAKSSNSTLDGARIIKGIEFLLDNLQDTQKVYGIAKQIAAATGNLISVAKSRAQEETDPSARQKILNNAKELVAASTDFAHAVRTAAIEKDKKSVEVLVKAGQKLTDATLKLEKSMKLKEDDFNESAKKLLLDSRALAVTTVDLINSSTAVLSNPESKRANEELNLKSASASAALQVVLTECGSLNPTIQKCDEIAAALHEAAMEIEMILSTDSLPKNIQKDSHEKIIQISRKIAANIKELPVYLNAENEQFSSFLSQFEVNGPSLSKSLLLYPTSNHDQKITLLTNGKNLLFNLRDLINSVKSSLLSDPSATANLMKYSDLSNKYLGLILQNIQSDTALYSSLEKYAQDIQTEKNNLPVKSESIPYAQARVPFLSTARDISTLVTTLINTNKKNTGEIGIISGRLAELIPDFNIKLSVCHASSSIPEAKEEMVSLGKTVCVDVGELIKLIKNNTEGKENMREVLDAYNKVNINLTKLIGTVEKGSIGEVMVEKAIGNIKAAILKLTLADLSSRNGAPSTENEKKEPLSAFKERFSAILNKLSDSCADIKKTVKNGEIELGEAAGTIAADICEAIDEALTMKNITINPNYQRDVCSLMMEIASETSELIVASKYAQRNIHDNTASKMITFFSRDITEKTHKVLNVIEDASKDLQRYQSEIDTHKQRILQTINASSLSRQTGTPEQCVETTRSVLSAIGKLLHSGMPPISDFSSHLSTITSSTEKLLKITKSVAEMADDIDIEKVINSSAMSIARSLLSLFESLSSHIPVAPPPSPLPAGLDDSASTVASSVNAYVFALKRLPNTESISTMDSGSTDDLEEQAEKELMKCAQIIADAAKSLLSTQRESTKATLSLNQDDINDAIIDAARVITEATGTLVKRSIVAQKERRQPTGSTSTYHKDPTWANGLISGAQAVAGSVQQLVKSANAAVEGSAEEVALVVSAQGVATSTAHLLTAARAKADASSAAQISLANAAGSVSSATKQLVTVARAVSEFEAEEEEVEAFVVGTVGIRREMEQQTKVMQLEKQLETERRALMDMRKMRYKK
uniref:FERM domain-containing protein n=1 Tax=Arcella intermedia TaxID=1963864 RepID=A0A6B2KWB8_9EUKA